MNILNKADFATLEHISLDQFFPLICAESHRHETIWQNRPAYEIVWRVFDCAKKIIEDWDYSIMDPLHVEIAPPNILHLENGHHRSFVLGCLLLQERINFEPIPVLNTAKLQFNTASDTSIRISYSADEFLQGSRLAIEEDPIGEIPSQMRLTNHKLYEKKTNRCLACMEELKRCCEFAVFKGETSRQRQRVKI